MGGPSSQGLAADVVPVAEGWLERSGVGFAVARREAGKAGDPLLFALLKAHRRMHDGRRVDAAERERIAEVVVAPRHQAPTVPMVEGAPDDDPPEVLARRLRRRGRIAMLVPAGKVTGFVPQWKRPEPDPVGANVAAGGDGAGGGSAYLTRRDLQPHGASLLRTLGSQPAIAGASTTPPVEAPASFPSAEIPPQSAPQVSAPAQTTDCAPATARRAGAPAVAPPSAGAPVEKAKAAPAAKAPRPKAPRPKRVPSIERIIAVAERHAGLAPGGLGLGRAPAVTAARQVAMWLAFTLLQWDLARIGGTFGRDRTTVRYAVQTVTGRAERDDAFADALDGLVAEAKAEPRTRRRKIAP